ncbi:MAG: N-6 DNA methylase, partial [Planctomycetes bacterium]|nr:N-6 DNA methylase [Planctomycetota bacterium]
KVGGGTKAPDYGFRIGGVRKFFVEAKKPSVDIKADAGPAFQLRRYAWSAKLPLSILSDFEELAVYDCRVKPVRSDKASTARVLYFRYEEYPQRWAELASVFSREAILKGSFDKYAESSRRKRGTAEVDDAFLAEIEQWRDMLARNLALRNPDLTQRDLNFAVQRTIDRIVFLRICEDRGIELYGALQALCATQTEPRASARGQHAGPVAHAQGSDSGKVYQRLFALFRRADERYNSGLFHFSRERGRPEEPDDLTPGLTIDDKPLKDILARLYYPESPYEFSVLPADILGQVYEQFLGKVIRLTKGHRAVVEEKPEVRKAGGVYYTPTYIVDYIVKHTVGKLIEGKTPQQVGGLTDTFQPSKAKGVRPLTVLDPACGSGSFLLGAYQFLLDWYRDRYLADGPQTHAAGRNPRLFQHPSGDWRLTTAERKRILLAHIHGVDIDSQAVETTKLSLLLKVLEGENAETLGSSLRLFHERALPDLAANIKCGNSLIGPDFYDNQQMAMFDEEERLRINVFDWQAEFPQMFNPPRANEPNRDRQRAAEPPRAHEPPRDRQRAAEPNRARKKAAPPSPHAHRQAVAAPPAEPLSDGRGSDHGLADSGFDAVIGNPPYVLLQDEYRDDAQLSYFRSHYQCATFKLDTYHLFMEQAVRLTIRGGRTSMITPANFLTNNYLDVFRRFLLAETAIDHILVIDGGVFHGISVDNAVWVVRRGATSAQTFRVTRARPETSSVSETHRVELRTETVLADPHALFTGSDSTKSSNLWKRCVERSTPLGQLAHVNFGKQLRNRKVYEEDVVRMKVDACVPPRYRPCYTGRDVGRYALRWGYLACMNDRVAQCGGCWDDVKQDARNKLITRQIGKYPVFALDELGYQCLNTVFMVNVKGGAVDTLFLLGILNSRLLAALWLDRFYDRRRTFPKIKGTYLKDLPIHTVEVEHPTHARMVGCVRQMLGLHKQLATAKTAHAKTAIQRQIDATDRQIDQLVYELYGLTDDEIRIVEEATQ